MIEPRTSWGYMPLYVADYQADTSHLSTLEHGAYLLLIMAYWRSGGALPASDLRMANISHLSMDAWQAIKPTIIEFFYIQDQRWHHKRIDAELEKFCDKSTKASNARKAGLEKRRMEKQARDGKLDSTDVQRTFNERSTDVQRSPRLNGRSTDVDVENLWKSDKSFVSDENVNGRSTDVQRTFNHADADADAVVLVVNDLLPATEVLSVGRDGDEDGKPPTERLNDSERFEFMKSALAGYMQMNGQRPNVKPPDAAIVKKCLIAVNGSDLKSVAEFLRDRYVNREQSPRHPNGPRKYGWFVTVLTEEFGKHGK